MAKKMGGKSVRKKISGEALPFRAGRKLSVSKAPATVSPMQTVAKR